MYCSDGSSYFFLPLSTRWFQIESMEKEAYVHKNIAVKPVMSGQVYIHELLS